MFAALHQVVLGAAVGSKPIARVPFRSEELEAFETDGSVGLAGQLGGGKSQREGGGGGGGRGYAASVPELRPVTPQALSREISQRSMALRSPTMQRPRRSMSISSGRVGSRDWGADGLPSPSRAAYSPSAAGAAASPASAGAPAAWESSSGGPLAPIPASVTPTPTSGRLQIPRMDSSHSDSGTEDRGGGYRSGGEESEGEGNARPATGAEGGRKRKVAGARPSLAQAVAAAGGLGGKSRRHLKVKPKPQDLWPPPLEDCATWAYVSKKETIQEGAEGDEDGGGTSGEESAAGVQRGGFPSRSSSLKDEDEEEGVEEGEHIEAWMDSMGMSLAFQQSFAQLTLVEKKKKRHSMRVLLTSKKVPDILGWLCSPLW